MLGKSFLCQDPTSSLSARSCRGQDAPSSSFLCVSARSYRVLGASSFSFLCISARSCRDLDASSSSFHDVSAHFYRGLMRVIVLISVCFGTLSLWPGRVVIHILVYFGTHILRPGRVVLLIPVCYGTLVSWPGRICHAHIFALRHVHIIIWTRCYFRFFKCKMVLFYNNAFSSFLK